MFCLNIDIKIIQHHGNLQEIFKTKLSDIHVHVTELPLIPVYGLRAINKGIIKIKSFDIVYIAL